LNESPEGSRAIAVIGRDGNKWKGQEEYDPEVSTLYASYCHYCRESGRTPKTTQTFSTDLLELTKQILGWDVIKKLKKYRGKPQKVICGLRLRSAHDGDLPLVEENLKGNHPQEGNHSVTTSVTTLESAETGEGNHGNRLNPNLEKETEN
jgi:putative DNA primase/helicase